MSRRGGFEFDGLLQKLAAKTKTDHVVSFIGTFFLGYEENGMHPGYQREPFSPSEWRAAE